MLVKKGANEYQLNGSAKNTRVQSNHTTVNRERNMGQQEKVVTPPVHALKPRSHQRNSTFSLKNLGGNLRTETKGAQRK